jgi:hypothetical protein
MKLKYILWDKEEIDATNLAYYRYDYLHFTRGLAGPTKNI